MLDNFISRIFEAIIACLNSVLLLPIFGAFSRRGPCPGNLVLLFPISIKPLDILFPVDYYRLINKLTAKEKPMTDILETYTEENELEHLSIEEILGHVVEVN